MRVTVRVLGVELLALEVLRAGDVDEPPPGLEASGGGEFSVGFVHPLDDRPVTT